jgi:hypothetical protein
MPFTYGDYISFQQTEKNKKPAEFKNRKRFNPLSAPNQKTSEIPFHNAPKIALHRKSSLKVISNSGCTIATSRVALHEIQLRRIELEDDS